VGDRRLTMNLETGTLNISDNFLAVSLLIPLLPFSIKEIF
jgi:hypothetical protein